MVGPNFHTLNVNAIATSEPGKHMKIFTRYHGIGLQNFDNVPQTRPLADLVLHTHLINSYTLYGDLIGVLLSEVHFLLPYMYQSRKL